MAEIDCMAMGSKASNRLLRLAIRCNLDENTGCSMPLAHSEVRTHEDLVVGGFEKP